MRQVTSPPVRVLIIIPTYEEAHTIEAVLLGVRAACDAHVLVVDDASPDGTADIAESLCRSLGGVNVLRRPAKSGLGTAYRAGFAWGLERGYQVLVEMDGDLSHDPAALPHLISATEVADLAIASRYVEGGTTLGWSWHRRQLSRWANRYSARVLGLSVRDATSGFRAYRAEVLRLLDLATLQSEGYAFQIEVVDLLAHAGATIAEVPTCFKEREQGKSKMSVPIILEALRLVSAWGVRRRIPVTWVGVLRASERYGHLDAHEGLGAFDVDAAGGRPVELDNSVAVGVAVPARVARRGGRAAR